MLRRGVLPYAGRRSSFVVIVVVRNAMLNCRLKNKKWRRSKEEAKKRIEEKVMLVIRTRSAFEKNGAKSRPIFGFSYVSSVFPGIFPMIASINETALANMDKATLKVYLNALFEQALDVIKLSSEWPIVGYRQNVTTRRRKRLSEKTPMLPLPPTSSSMQQQLSSATSDHYYIQRQSEHADITYDQFRQVLLESHSMNEPKYVDLLVEAKELNSLLKKTDTKGDDSIEAGIYWLGFKASVASPREFVELVATKEFNDSDNPYRSFLVVSVPVDTSDYTRKGHVRGKYLSWEYVCEKGAASAGNGSDHDATMGGKDGKMVVEWTCVQQSSAGGWVPGVLSDWVATKEFHKDVASLVDYIKYKQL
jgi:hypothetical protein